MRRLPSSWTTVFTQLGFRRKFKKHHRRGERGRRSRFEPLEARQMLAVLVVDSTADTVASDGYVTLREAIAAANNDTATEHGHTGDGGDTIVFDPAVFNTQKTITLGGTQLTIAEDLTIEGPGADLLSISGDDASRVFKIDSGVAATLQDLTVTEGYVNQSSGGGIWSEGDQLTLNRVVVSDNVATRTSGSTAGRGGGVFSAKGNLTIIDSQIEYNQGFRGSGVAKYRSADGETFELINSTVAYNDLSGAYGAHAYGGGLFLEAYGSMESSIVNSTISHNTALRGAGIEVWGGNADNVVDVVNSTIAFNDAIGVSGAQGPGGIDNFGGTVTIHNTIVAGNTSNSVHSRNLSATAIDTASSYNVIGEQGTSPSWSGSGNQYNVSNADVALAPLDYYGGRTKTHALLATSYAIDAGDYDLAEFPIEVPLEFDQRGEGYSRLLGTEVDVGATEAHVVDDNGEISVYGTVRDDEIIVSATSVTIDSVGVFYVDVAGATGLNTFGFAGNDKIRVLASVAAQIEGGVGDDTYILGDSDSADHVVVDAQGANVLDFFGCPNGCDRRSW